MLLILGLARYRKVSSLVCQSLGQPAERVAGAEPSITGQPLQAKANHGKGSWQWFSQRRLVADRRGQEDLSP